MMLLRNLGALFLAATLAMAGCSGSGKRAATPPSSPAPTTSTAAAAGAGSTPAGQIAVSAPESLTDTLTALGKEFEAIYPGTKVVLTFGASAEQAAQIAAGRAPDVFVAATAAIMKQVTDAGVADGQPKVVARNRLVIAVPPSNPARVTVLADLARPGVRVALCAQQVPCGANARRVLGTAGLTVTPVRVLPDGRAAVPGIKAGELDAALVYRPVVKPATADVTGIEFGEAADVVDDYPMVALKSAANRLGSAAFLGFATSARARQIFADADFETP
jgi:molybdate transport system substrate-binding protein